MRCSKGFKNVNTCISDGLFFFERCSLINATVCANKFHNYDHIIAVMRHLFKKSNPLLHVNIIRIKSMKKLFLLIIQTQVQNKIELR